MTSASRVRDAEHQGVSVTGRGHANTARKGLRDHRNRDARHHEIRCVPECLPARVDVGERLRMLRLGRWKRPAGAIHIAGRKQVVLQVLSDARQVASSGNPESRKFGARAQTGSHQYCRRSNDPGGQDDGAPGVEPVDRAAFQSMNPGCASGVVEGQPVDEQACAQIEVRPGANGLGHVGIGDALAPTIHDRERVERRPRQVLPIVVADRAEPELHPGQAMGPGERVRPGRLAEPHRTRSAIAVFRREGRRFRTHEVGPERGPVPPGSACLGPPVEVFRVAADMTHRIHRAGPAHRATPRPRMRASCH